MLHKSPEGQVHLEFTADEWKAMLVHFGMLTAAVRRLGDEDTFYSFLAFANRLLQGSPGYQPYAVPAEYAHGIPGVRRIPTDEECAVVASVIAQLQRPE